MSNKYGLRVDGKHKNWWETADYQQRPPLRNEVTKECNHARANAPKQTLYFVSEGPVGGAKQFKSKHVMSHKQADGECGCAEAEKGEE